MERGELIRRLVLDMICDCLENVDQCILPTVSKDCIKLGFSIERSDIVDAMTSLVADGLAEAYIMPDVEHALEGMPSLDVVEEYFKTYFCITKKRGWNSISRMTRGGPSTMTTIPWQKAQAEDKCYLFTLTTA